MSDAWYAEHEDTPTHLVTCHVDVQVLVAIPPDADHGDALSAVTGAVVSACDRLDLDLGDSPASTDLDVGPRGRVQPGGLP